MNMPLTSDEANACKRINRRCPIKRGEDITLNFSYRAHSIPINATVNLEISVRDEHHKTIFCVRFTANVYNTRKIQCVQ